MPTRLPTPPGNPPPLVLCADGGGSKVCVVIRSADGLEVRGTAGPCNVLSVGHGNAIKAILLATYRALSQLPPSHLHPELVIPSLIDHAPTNGHTTPANTPSSPLARPVASRHHLMQATDLASPYASRPGSPTRTKLPPINVPIFQYVWLGLAGISTPADSKLFMPLVTRDLCVNEARVKISNDVNILAAPALDIPGVDHVVAVVCGTGTVGRTIRIDKAVSTQSSPGLEGVDAPVNGGGKIRRLPLEDVAVARGWGYLLCDEGSAFWIGRLAIRSVLFYADRVSATSIHSSPTPSRLPLHNDLLEYLGCDNPMEVIDVTSLSGPYVEGLSVGEAVAKRNALMAGAAKVVFKYAFPETASTPEGPPSPPMSLDSDKGDSSDLIQESRKEALRLATKSVEPMVELTSDLLGDRTVVDPRHSALSLGGGLWNSDGYRMLFLDTLKKVGIEFKEVLVVGDPGGEGAKGLARVEFD